MFWSFGKNKQNHTYEARRSGESDRKIAKTVNKVREHDAMDE